MKFKISPLLVIVLLDIGLLLLISAIIAGGLYLLKNPFWSSFIIVFGLISFIGIISNKIIDGRNSIILNKIELEKSKILNDQTINLTCAYCSTQNPIKLNINEEMSFDCLSCKQPNKILLSYGTARITTPLNVSMPIQPRIPDDKE